MSMCYDSPAEAGLSREDRCRGVNRASIGNTIMFDSEAYDDAQERTHSLRAAGLIMGLMPKLSRATRQSGD
jgi:hypothetical protein